jgi:hypothetical protein
VYRTWVQKNVKKTSMASPFADPRTGQLYFRRAVPEALRPAFEGKAVVKVSLRTKDPAEAKIGFARENAEFETKLAEARRRFAEGTLVPTPGALVRRWCEAPATGTGLSGQQRLVVTFMELDAAAGSRKSIGVDDPFPPAIMGPPSNTDWNLVCADKVRFERMVADSYEGDVEQTGTNWIRLRWHHDESLWRPCLTGPAIRLKAFDPGAAHFSEDEIVKALMDVIDEKRSGDEEVNRRRLSRHRPRVPNSRRRPNLRLKTLFHEWKAGNEPRPQTAGEFHRLRRGSNHIDDRCRHAVRLPRRGREAARFDAQGGSRPALHGPGVQAQGRQPEMRTSYAQEAGGRAAGAAYLCVPTALDPREFRERHQDRRIQQEKAYTT